MEWLDGAQYDCKEVGNAQQEYIKILIREDTAVYIRKMSRRLVGAKSFGLLIGNKYESGDHIILYIDGAAPIGKLGTGATRSIMTDKKWIEIKEQILKKNPGKEIVGWYGVRMGLGAMLTEEDQRMHQNFFNKPWQIIYLVDGKSGAVNLYYWDFKKLKSCNGYYQLGEYAKEKGKKRSNAIKFMVRSTVAVAAIALSFMLYIEYIHPSLINWWNEERSSIEANSTEEEHEIQMQYAHEIEELKTTIHNLENSLKAKEDEIKALRELIEQVQKDTEQENAERSERAENEQNKNKSAKAKDDYKDNSKNNSVVHVVKKGDTLYRISIKYYGDPSYKEALRKVNKIPDYQSLKVGDSLVIPSKDEIKNWK